MTAGELLVEVGNLAELEVVVDLLSTDAVQVQPGSEVLIEDWGGGDTLRGRVRRVEPFAFTKVSALGIDEQRTNVRIDLTSPPREWAALGHGYRVVTRIVTWRGEDVIDADGRARLRPVSLGRFTDRAVEVTAGLEPGEAVVLHPIDRIEDGARVVQRAETIG